jgi:hypothetical protein
MFLSPHRRNAYTSCNWHRHKITSTSVQYRLITCDTSVQDKAWHPSIHARQALKVCGPERALRHEDLELLLRVRDRGGRPHAGALEAAPVEARLRPVRDVDRDLCRDRRDLLHADARERRVHTRVQTSVADVVTGGSGCVHGAGELFKEAWGDVQTAGVVGAERGDELRRLRTDVSIFADVSKIARTVQFRFC